MDSWQTRRRPSRLGVVVKCKRKIYRLEEELLPNSFRDCGFVKEIEENPGTALEALVSEQIIFEKMVKSPALIHVFRRTGIPKESFDLSKNRVSVLFEHGSSVYGRLIAYKTTLADLR